MESVEENLIGQIERAKSANMDFSNQKPIDIAKKIFKFEGFKENGQEQIINHILKKRNAIGIIPTGGGKSACFQIPAIIQKNLTIVISPLIALMKDQVENLVRKGFDGAFFINSSIEENIQEKIMELTKSNKVKILYIAPESLHNEKIKNILSELKIDLIVIDEVHCISTWGHNFRPDYLKIPEIIKELGSPPILALTATATNEVLKDIKKQLKLKFTEFKVSFDRPELYLATREIQDNVYKKSFLLDLINNLEGSTVIFTRTRNLAENLSVYLNKKGVKNIFYHAGLTSYERSERQNLFMEGKCKMIIATIAFGMGIDKENIRNIIHYNIPQSVEGYYQEIGRAGRDGNLSKCILLFTEGDVKKIKSLIASDWPDKKKIKELLSHLGNQNKYFFLFAKSLENSLGIKEIPLRLILHRLEEAGVVKTFKHILYEAKISFNKSPGDMIKLAEKKDHKDLSRIFNSEYFLRIKSIINLEILMEDTKLNYFRILELVRKLVSERHISFTNEKYKDLIFVKKKLNSFNISPIAKIFENILNKNYKKIDDLVECLSNGKCVRKNILNYFGEKISTTNCGRCSTCEKENFLMSIPKKLNKNYAKDEEIYRLNYLKLNPNEDELYITLLKSIVVDRIISEKDFSNILTGNLHHFSAKWKFNLKSYELLIGENVNEIEKTLKNILSKMLIEVTPEGDLRITKMGIEFLEGNKEIKKSEKKNLNVKTNYHKKLEQIKEEFPKAYEPWEEEEDNKLKEMFSTNISIKALAKIFKRQPGAIRSRLKKFDL